MGGSTFRRSRDRCSQPLFEFQQVIYTTLKIYNIFKRYRLLAKHQQIYMGIQFQNNCVVFQRVVDVHRFFITCSCMFIDLSINFHWSSMPFLLRRIRGSPWDPTSPFGSPQVAFGTPTGLVWDPVKVSFWDPTGPQEPHRDRRLTAQIRQLPGGSAP